MFRLGMSFCRNYLNLEGYLQVGFSSKTIKNYKPVDNNDQNVAQMQNETNESVKKVEKWISHFMPEHERIPIKRLLW